MSSYPAWIDGEQGASGVSFPDLPGIVAMGTTVEKAVAHAEEALRDYVIETERDGEPITPPTSIEHVETPKGYTPVSVPLIRLSGGSVRANLTLDEGRCSVHRRRSAMPQDDPDGLRRVDGSTNRSDRRITGLRADGSAVLEGNHGR